VKPGAAPGRPIPDIRRFERILREREARLVESLQGLKERTFGSSLKESTGEDSTYDQHSADLALPTFEREKDLGLKDGLEIDLAKVRLALGRIADGTYGYCLRCKRPIPEGRLEAMPEAELCVECAREEEVRPPSRRPVEEQIPMRPMGGFETLADDVNARVADRSIRGRLPTERGR